MGNTAVEKAYEITDAKISYVSLVGKAANKRNFLIAKAEDGKATFSTYGQIVKADQNSHYVTGIVYEPLTEDYDGNFMREEEITKACYGFAKSGSKVDLQHSFEPLPSASVVESWIAKSDSEIEGVAIKKGTWLMTVEVTDDKVWDAITKGEITGFSMGGQGCYSEEDTDLTKLQKGAVADAYAARNKASLFWNAMDSLESALRRYDYQQDKSVYEDDEQKIREALTDFNQIITDLLTNNTVIIKALNETKPVEKAGKSLSSKNKEALQGIYDTLGTFLSSFEDTKPEDSDEGQGEEGKDGDGNSQGSGDIKKNQKKEESEMTMQEVEKAVKDEVVKAVAAALAPPQTTGGNGNAGDGNVTQDMIQKMVGEAVEKAMKPKEEPVTMNQVQEMITKAVGEALNPILEARGLPTNMNNEPNGTIQKSEQHYLHGLL